MKFLLLILISALLSCNATYYSKGNADNNELSLPPKVKTEGEKPSGPGCYARCLIPDRYEYFDIPIIEYIGDNYKDPNVKYTSIIVKEKTSKWLKKKANKNCLSANPEDCLVWCLIEVEPEYYDYYTVIDTNVNKEFFIVNVEAKDLIEPGGFTEWKEVICDNQITDHFYYDLQEALIDAGYVSSENREYSPKYGPILKAGLVKFQKDRGLPVGQFDLETLSHLRIEY